jgi:hypothetical protein
MTRIVEVTVAWFVLTGCVIVLAALLGFATAIGVEAFDALRGVIP